MGQYIDKTTDLVINEMTKAQYESLLAQDLISDTELYFITDDNYRDLFYLKGETYSKVEIDRMFGDLSGLELNNYYTKTETKQVIDSEVSKIIGAAPEAYNTLKEVADYIESDLSNTSAMLASIANKANSADVYSKSVADGKFALKSEIPEPTDLSNYYTKAETLDVIDKIAELDNYYDKDEINAKVETINATKQDILQSNVNIKTINGQSILGSGNITIKEGSGTSGGGGGGTTVVANPELTGDETKLRGITIADTNYSVMASEMSFSDVPVESDLKLANIQIGSDNWSIVSEAWVNQKFETKDTELKNYTDTKIANLVDSAPEALNTLGEISTLLQENDSLIDGLLTEVGKKANAAETYTKTETDNKYVEKSTLNANPNVSEITPRLESLRVNGTDYIVSPDVSLVLTGWVDENGNKTVSKLTVNDDVWNMPVKEGGGNVDIDLTGYATEDWVNAQGFLKGEGSLTDYATKEWVEDKNYLTQHQSLAGYATQSYVDGKVASLVNGAPETLDTLNELAAAISENDTLTDTLNQAIGNKADKSELFSGSYNDLTNKPFIPTSYNDLTDKPTIPTTFSYEDLTDKPELVTSYNQLTDKPFIPTSYTELANKPFIPTSYNQLTDTPNVPNITYSSDVPTDTSNMNAGDIVLVPGVGGSSGGAEYEFVLLYSDTSGNSSVSSKTVNSTNVTFWYVGVSLHSGADNMYQAFPGSMLIPNAPFTQAARCAGESARYNVTTCTETTLSLTYSNGVLRYIYAFRKK